MVFSALTMARKKVALRILQQLEESSMHTSPPPHTTKHRFPIPECVKTARASERAWKELVLEKEDWEDWSLRWTPQVGGRLKVYHDGSVETKKAWFERKLRDYKPRCSHQLMGNLVDVYWEKVRACHIWILVSDRVGEGGERLGALHKAFGAITWTWGNSETTHVFESMESLQKAYSALVRHVCERVS